jgi:hypothetical protein
MSAQHAQQYRQRASSAPLLTTAHQSSAIFRSLPLSGDVDKEVMEIGREKVRKAGPAEPGRTRKKVCMFTRTSAHRFLVALIVSTTAAVVFAASPHYKKGGQPVCTANGATVTCSTGTVTGLGNFDVEVSVTFTASQGQLCHAPGNDTSTVPGQNPAIGTGGGGVSIPAGDIKNGNLIVPSISATATITQGTADTAGCPNSNWSVTLDGPVTISGGVYTFESPPGTEIKALSFTF